jgi:hypothetical protein
MSHASAFADEFDDPNPYQDLRLFRDPIHEYGVYREL